MASQWQGEAYPDRGGEVRHLLGDTAKRESRKQSRRYCIVAVGVCVLVVFLLAVVLGVALGTAAYLNRLPSDPHERAEALLTQYPLIDGLVSYQLLCHSWRCLLEGQPRR